MERILYCLAVTGRDGEYYEDRQKNIVEMEPVKNLSLEKEHLLRVPDNRRALLVQPLWQQQFESVRSLQSSH